MIYQNDDFEKAKIKFLSAFKELQLSKLLYKANIAKACGISVTDVFQFLLLLIFFNKNLYRFLNSKYNDKACSKNTYYRFLTNTSYNWARFIRLLAAKIIMEFSKLTRKNRVKVFIIDDSTYTRNRSKKVELLAKVYDHVSHKFIKGFTMLTLGWSDGYSFIPVSFNMLSSSCAKNILCQMKENIDKRSNAYKFRADSMLQKPAAVIKMVREALDAGIEADYVLMDTWFTQEPLIFELKNMGMDVIGMVKQLKQQYIYNSKSYTLPELARLAKYEGLHTIKGSIVVRTKKHNIPVKLVFVANRNKKSECLYILSTNCELSDEEIIRIYGNRWSIETFFKASKSLLNLEKEFQTRDYTATVAHTSIVFTRYMLLEWIKRNENDERSFGELFFMMCDEIQDMDFATALQRLLALIEDFCKTQDFSIAELKKQVVNWITGQPSCIRNLLAI